MTDSAAPRAKLAELLFRFGSDRRGSYPMLTAVVMPVLVGFSGLSTEYGLWVYKHKALSSAADSGAVSAATAGGNFQVEAAAVISTYGFVDGAKGVTITVNQPPQSGSHKNTSGAVEVIVQQTQQRLFSAIYSAAPVTIGARAVAVKNWGNGCVLALDRTASGAISTQGSAQVALQGCSLYDDSSSGSALTIGGTSTLSTAFVGVVGGISGGSGLTSTNGVKTGMAPATDPYAGVNPPSFFGCDEHNFSAKSTVTIDPGVYCGGMKINAGANVTLNPGTYFIDEGSLSVAGGATLTGSGVTLVFTSSSGGNWAAPTINGSANVDLTAPTTGPMAGIVIFGDRNMPLGTSFKLNGGSTQYFGGAIYGPQAAISFNGGSSTGTGCTQLIGDTVSFAGNSNLQINCGSAGTKAIGSLTATLVE